MTAEHMLTDHLNAATRNPNIRMETPDIHQTIDTKQYEKLPYPQGLTQVNIYISTDPKITAERIEGCRRDLENNLKNIYDYDDAIYLLRTLETRHVSKHDSKTCLELEAILKNPEHRNPEKPFAQKLKDKLALWKY